MPFWIVDSNSRGDPVLLPPKGQKPFELYSRAESYKDEKCTLHAEVIDLPTTNRSRATQMMKAKRVDKFSSTELGMRKFRHPKGG